MDGDFYKAVENRRSVYGIGKDQTVSDVKILKIVRHAVKFAPSAFNSQSARVVVLFGREHEKLWDFTLEILKQRVPPERFAQTKKKIETSFRAGYGTILYFEDQNTVASMQKQFPSYADNFPVWSLQSSGMLQFIIWAALESEGLGVNLQHYNPLIDERVKKEWDIPAEWKLLSQMPFGSPLEKPDEKEFLPLEQRIKVFK
jgi:predicted oxidoreductase (fatty acid repression mutant protein)